ncbi:hypothetical protein AAH979_28840 [Plantactinospora sp. ZYX-F-223]|uniref:hypothetical protein n=1 Tax=Plantactinospora sp. ZYX-F-223 TaxID=3144103 RepID=UPI0031FCECAA
MLTPVQARADDPIEVARDLLAQHASDSGVPGVRAGYPGRCARTAVPAERSDR